MSLIDGGVWKALFFRFLNKNTLSRIETILHIVLRVRFRFRFSKVKRPTRHIIGHFGDESSQATNCTGTDNKKTNKLNKPYTLQKPKNNTKNMPYLTLTENLKLQLSPGLVVSYDIQPENAVGLF